MIEMAAGSTDVTVEVYAVDALTGLPRTGLVAGGVTGRYVRTRAASASISLSALASASAAHADGGFIEIDATNCKGWYRLDLPDAVVASGAAFAVVVLQSSGVLLTPVRLQLASAAAGGIEAEVHLCKAALVNRRVHTVSTGVDEIFDDDGVTSLLRLVPMDAGDDAIAIEPE